MVWKKGDKIEKKELKNNFHLNIFLQINMPANYALSFTFAVH